MTPELKQVFESSINQMAAYIYCGIAIGLLAGIAWMLKGWLLSLPVRFIKWIACYFVEAFGHLTSCTAREIKRMKRKITKTVDIVESAKDITDTYNSLKK